MVFETDIFEKFAKMIQLSKKLAKIHQGTSNNPIDSFVFTAKSGGSFLTNHNRSLCMM